MGGKYFALSGTLKLTSSNFSDTLQAGILELTAVLGKTELFEDAAHDTEVTQVPSELANVFASVVEMDVVSTECVLTTAKGIFEVLHSDLE